MRVQARLFQKSEVWINILIWDIVIRSYHVAIENICYQERLDDLALVTLYVLNWYNLL